MGYDFSFIQFPTKDFFELWGDFLDGKIEKKIDERIQKLKTKTYQKETPTGTWESNRDAWIIHRKAWETMREDHSAIESWEQQKKDFEYLRALLKTAKTKTEQNRLIKEATEMFIKLFGEQNPYAKRILLVENCASFSDSAKSNAYFFLVQIFSTVHKRNLDSTKNMPTPIEWHQLFQALKPEFFEKEFSSFCKKSAVSENEKEHVRKECLELLFTLKHLVKSALEKEWDLWFTSDFDEQEHMQKKKMRFLATTCREMYTKSLQEIENM